MSSQSPGARAALGRPISILVVEDEAIVARDLEVTLRGLGYAVEGTIGDGTSAIAAAEALRPDLVLMDIRLRGGIDGIQAATEIWRRLGIAVVFLSAYSDDETLRRARAALPFGYLVKPFLAQQLRPAIEVAVHRERSDRELRENNRRLQNALEALDAAVVISDGADQIRWTNPRTTELCGGTPESLLGSRLSDLFPDVDRHPVPTAGRGVVRGRLGGPLTVHFCRAALEDGAGGNLLTFRPVTEPADEAAERGRLGREALARVVSGLADHTRAPLLALSSTLQLVEIQPTARGFAHDDAVPLLKRQVERIRDVVNYVVQFAGTGLAPETVAAGELVDQAIRRTQPLASERGVSVVALGPQAWPELFVDPDRLGKALDAVIENALQHSRSGSEVVVSGRASAADRRFRLTIDDSGPGFAEADLELVCEPFFSRRAGGTGMGLALARRIAELHAGTLEVSNRAGGGARVVLDLPLTAEGSTR